MTLTQCLYCFGAIRFGRCDCAEMVRLYYQHGRFLKSLGAPDERRPHRLLAADAGPNGAGTGAALVARLPSHLVISRQEFADVGGTWSFELGGFTDEAGLALIHCSPEVEDTR